MLPRLIVIGMLALILVFVFSVGFSYTVYAYEGANNGENNNSGDKWGGVNPGQGGGPGAITDPGYSDPPGQTP